MGTWKLWECLSTEALVKLMQYQWETYALRLNLMNDAYRELEPLEEIDRLMRKAPSRSRGG